MECGVTQNKRVLMCHIWISSSEATTGSCRSGGGPLIETEGPGMTYMLKDLQQSTKRILRDFMYVSPHSGNTHWWIIIYSWSHLHMVPPLPLWFIGVASICKQAGRLQATGAAPWVQCYLLSQPKRGSPQAGNRQPRCPGMVFLPLPISCAVTRRRLQRGTA